MPHEKMLTFDFVIEMRVTLPDMGKMTYYLDTDDFLRWTDTPSKAERFLTVEEAYLRARGLYGRSDTPISLGAFLFGGVEGVCIAISIETLPSENKE